MAPLWAASLRHLLRHPAQLTLALVGLSIGVATIVSVDIATASSARAFELSMQAVNGAATHEITAGSGGIEERLYVELRKRGAGSAFAPLVEGYVTVGDRTFQLVGIDPFASPRFEGPADHSAGRRSLDAASIASTRWFTQAGAVVMAASAARELGIAVNGSFSIAVGGRTYTATLIGTIAGEQAGYDALILTDIAQAQEWLGFVGRLTRIDVRLPAGAAGETAAATLRAGLPAGVRLERAEGRARQNLDMTSAFTTNLKAMSLLALLVSLLLIYGAISFAVIQRRRVVGILRALGATRGDVLLILLAEAAAIGVVGAGLGLLLGTVIARALVALVSRTINDLYFVVAVNQTVLPPGSIAKAFLAGVATALVGALLPALEAAGSPPALGLRRSGLEARAATIADRLAVVSAVLAVFSAAVALGSGRSLLGGFAALFLLLLSVAALTPTLLRTLTRAAARVAGRASPVARVAFGDIAASLSRTGVAVGALGMALTAMIGVSVMVGSFRESLREWLQRTMRADIYVTAPGPAADTPGRAIEPDVLRRLLATPGIADFSLSRHTRVELPGGPVELDVLQLPHAGRPGMPFVAGNPDTVWADFHNGDILVSEPLAYRLRLPLGAELTLDTGHGAHAFRVAGIYREYGSDRGAVMMSLRAYQRFWSDRSITGLGIFLAPPAQAAHVIAGLRAASRGPQALLIRSNAELRALSMAIFERTFVITRVLYWLAAGVAAVGLLSALLAWELERAREIALLRSLGVTPRAAALLIEAQTVFMSLVALLAAVPAGLLTALMLIDVINRRAFGWQLDLHLTGSQFANALLLSVTAALAAGAYPAWRSARAPIVNAIREE